MHGVYLSCVDTHTHMHCYYNYHNNNYYYYVYIYICVCVCVPLYIGSAWEPLRREGKRVGKYIYIYI